MMMLNWLGTDKRRVARSGRDDRSASAADLTEQLYRQGYQSANVTTLDGALVGQVFRDRDTGKRSWWADGSPLGDSCPP
jgi:phage gp46-like protein